MTISYDWSLHCERMHLCAPQWRLTKLLRLICLTKQGVDHPAGSYWPSGKEKSKCRQRAGASDSAAPCETELDKWVFVPCCWCVGLLVGKCIQRLGFHLALLSLLKIIHRCQTSWVIFIHDYVEEKWQRSPRLCGLFPLGPDAPLFQPAPLFLCCFLFLSEKLDTLNRKCFQQQGIVIQFAHILFLLMDWPCLRFHSFIYFYFSEG